MVRYFVGMKFKHNRSKRSGVEGQCNRCGVTNLKTRMSGTDRIRVWEELTIVRGMPLHQKISCQVLGEQMQKLVEDCQDKTGSQIETTGTNQTLYGHLTMYL